MLFFRRLLTYTIGSRLREHRASPRLMVGADFPLKGSLVLIGTDQLGVARAAAGSGCRWSGRPVNISHAGLSLQLPPAALAVRGEETTLVLSVEGRELSIPCVVAHFRSTSQQSLCGLSLKFSTPDSKAAYSQLLEAVGIGASFTPVKKMRGSKAREDLVGEQYLSGKSYVLTAWRRIGGRELADFELLLGNFCARGGPGADLEIYSPQPENRTGKAAFSAPALRLSNGKHAEVRQLYRWVVFNLPKSVPADLRALLNKFTTSPSELKCTTSPSDLTGWHEPRIPQGRRPDLILPPHPNR